MKHSIRKAVFGLLAGTLTVANCMTSFAGVWKQDSKGWWYENDDGSYYHDGWHWIDDNNDGVSEHYYFKEDGYILVNGDTPDGKKVNGSGAELISGYTDNNGSLVEVPDAGIKRRQVFSAGNNDSTAQENLWAKVCGINIEKVSLFENALSFATRDRYSSGEDGIDFDFFNDKLMGLKIDIEERHGESDAEMDKKIRASVDWWQNFYKEQKYSLGHPDGVKEYDINGYHWIIEEVDQYVYYETTAHTFSPKARYKIKFTTNERMEPEELLAKIQITDDLSTTWINGDMEIEEYYYNNLN